MTSTELQKAPTSTNGKSGTPAPAGAPGRLYAPRVDIVETEDALHLYADLPGVKPGDVSLHCRGEELILQARCTPRHSGQTAIHSEYGVGDYQRVFRIAEEVDPNGIEATLTNGVLAVRLPKAEKVRPRRIAVKG